MVPEVVAAGWATHPLVKVKHHQNPDGGMKMARHQLTIDDEMLHAIFQNDEGLARLVEAVLNQILKGQDCLSDFNPLYWCCFFDSYTQVGLFCM